MTPTMPHLREICYNSGMEPPVYYSRFSRTTVTSGHLPHWSQRCACFVTFRLADSLPETKLRAYQAERDEWLAVHAEPWDDAMRAEYEELFPQRFQKWLDAGYGSCALRSDSCRIVVENALRHFDGERYSLYAYVVMPNHVHALFMPTEGHDAQTIVSGWKSFSAKAVNKMLNRSGSFWQKESYDHLVRDVEEFNAIRSYIRANDPCKAWDAYVVEEE